MDDGSIGLPPLTVAATKGNNEVVSYLLARGANPNVGDAIKPLHAACSEKHYETAKILLEHGANPNAHGEGTPLLWAEQQPELAALLRQYGATERLPSR